MSFGLMIGETVGATMATFQDAKAHPLNLRADNDIMERAIIGGENYMEEYIVYYEYVDDSLEFDPLHLIPDARDFREMIGF